MAVIEKEIIAPHSLGIRQVRGSIGAAGLGAALAIAGWAALTTMWATGSAGRFGHDQEALPGLLGLGLFLLGWIVMIAAMMLPSSVATLRLLDRAPIVEENRAWKLMAGYFLIWTAFGAVAFVADQILHAMVDAVPWIAERPSLILGGVAMFAGAAEFAGRSSPPRYPAVRAGNGTASVGAAHAADRIRRCWPLMLFAMAVGMSAPGWMIALTALMALELDPRAQIVLRFAGLLLVAVGLAVIIHPSWLPVLFVGH